jgi:hypothetical protein
MNCSKIYDLIATLKYYVTKGYLKLLMFLLWLSLKTALVKNKYVANYYKQKKRFCLPVKFSLLSDEALSIYITKLNGITPY